jgi:hypothetical protein
MQMLALAGAARRWEPKRLRLRLFSAAVRIVRGGLPPETPPRPALALGTPDHCRNHPHAGPGARLNSPNRPCHQERRPPGARGTPRAGATTGPAG